ncbi:unnamed protein product [Leptidea sinapis]|uniref:Transcription initiation factor TFIID subunit 12 n=1 Tax=Leptidea sinapis TaxID=189913 RepID=A0A5E4Q722_9NEOP|nr:unnamed protein product [Leptidea sinapis]
MPIKSISASKRRQRRRANMPSNETSKEEGSPAQHSPVSQSQVSNKNNQSGDQGSQPLTSAKLQELVREVDPTVQLDEEVEEVLLNLADDFMHAVVNAACSVAKKRQASAVELKDVLQQLYEEVEEVLLELADDFLDVAVNASCCLAKHRHASTVELKDVQLHLERQWNMWIPGFGNDELRPYKRAAVTEAHKQRMALIRKTMKKY